MLQQKDVFFGLFFFADLRGSVALVFRIFLWRLTRAAIEVRQPSFF